MSRLSQRWWTQRNAIRNANCKTSWIIKFLNAYCALRLFLRAYLLECLKTPLVPTCCLALLCSSVGGGLWPSSDVFMADWRWFKYACIHACLKFKGIAQQIRSACAPNLAMPCTWYIV